MSDTPRKPSLNKLSLKREATSEQFKLEERLHKVLAQAGLGSRRALEQRIAEGLVKVNGEVAQTGMSVRSGDRIELDGRGFVATALAEPSRVLVYNKPEGEVTTREDPEGRPTVFESLPALKGARWIAVGRLDINTTGLLLATTDGELANAMMHPSFEVEREYVVRVRAPEGQDKVDDNTILRLQRGVALEDGPAKFDEVERIGGTDSHDWFRVVVKEGRNREVRRLWESQGCQVSRLKRTRYGKVSLPRELVRGHSVELTTAQVDALRADLKLEEGAPSALTLQPVIGQRRAAKTTVRIGRDGGRGTAYVNGHNTADEGRELRRFDNVREDRGRGRGGKPGGGFKGGLTVSGEAAAKQSQRPFKARPQKNDRGLPEGNPAAFRSWYVPDGVSTGPSGHRNAGPAAARGPGARGPGGPGARGPGGPGARGPGARGPGQGGGYGQGQGEGGRGGYAKPKSPGAGAGGNRSGQGQGGQGNKHPYGHPGNAPSFPSDHANPGFSPYGSTRPASGNRGPGGNRSAGGPGGNRGPGGPGGNRGPGGPGGGNRGPGGPGGGNRGPGGPGGNRGRGGGPRGG